MSQPSQQRRNEYRQLFDTLEIRAERARAVDKLCAQALALVPTGGDTRKLPAGSLHRRLA